MKKLLYLLLLTPIIYLASCSSGKGDLTPEPLPIEEKIVGVTWQLLNVGGGWFRLNDDYTYCTKDYLCDTFAVEGVWSLNGDVIENRYIIGAVEKVYRNTIIEYSDSLLKFQSDTTPTADTYIWYEACEPEPIRGCMDSTFLNFNPNAQCPDTCIDGTVYGCMDANALNYDATADFDDGSCCYVGGCMDATALNYNANACQDDGSCCYIEGCVDTAAPNYNPNACQDDGSCLGIGDNYEGGIIFYLDGNGGGLIAATSDLQPANWGSIGVDYTGAEGLVIGTGYQNTIDIINEGSTPMNAAAYLCVNWLGGGYNDWFLPSIDELYEMYLTIGRGNLYGLGDIGNFEWSYDADIWYWSSTEIITPLNNTAATMSFVNGESGWFERNSGALVRAIRAF